ncbi:MAG: hypothetical protein JW912_01960 [Sedimentisphaerales bacterium]|nr:hypothetical protein [Sedimentisphaerales bacterium]
MKALNANLKIFYQRPILYLWYLIILAQLPALIISAHDINKTHNQIGPMFHLVMLMLFGLLVGSLQKEIMTRPVTYCLPGHHVLSNRLIFWLGALFTLIPIALLFNEIKASTDNYMLVAATVWSVGMAAYYLSVWLSFQEGYSQGKPCLVGLLWAIIFMVIFFGGHTKLWLVTVQTPLMVLLPSLIATGFSHVYLSRIKHIRNFCGQNIIGMFYKWDMRKVTAYRTAQATEKVRHRLKISAFVEQFITAKMKNCPVWKKKALLGFIYTSFDRMFIITQLDAVVIMSLLLISFGYAFGRIHANIPAPVASMLDIFYIFPVFGAMMHTFPSHSTLHIPASRKDKFHASVASAISIVIFAMVFVGILIGLANIIKPYMPVIPPHIINPSDHSVSFSAPSLSHIYIIPMLMPLGFIASVLFNNNRSKMMIIAGPVVFVCCWFYVMSQTFLNIRFAVPAIFTITWLGFIIVLQRRCMKRSLV